MHSDQQEIADLKNQVAHLTRLIEGLYGRMGEPVPGPELPTVENPPVDVLEAVRAGNLIVAIKLWRGYTGLGLAEAKAEVEQIAARYT
jgi:ribosomal protein L7/L12